VPYRDFFMEYPPGALAVFLPPAALGSSHYNATFKFLMALCGWRHSSSLHPSS
jgi:hypothetical protein